MSKDFHKKNNHYKTSKGTVSFLTPGRKKTYVGLPPTSIKSNALDSFQGHWNINQPQIF